MTKEEANKILNLWKTGAANFIPAIINHALTVCGDLTSTLD